jgi:hypothetical protein
MSGIQHFWEAASTPCFGLNLFVEEKWNSLAATREAFHKVNFFPALSES